MVTEPSLRLAICASAQSLSAEFAVSLITAITVAVVVPTVVISEMVDGVAVHENVFAESSH